MKWSFPENNSGETRGLNDSGIETFLGTPYKSLAREICQNSLDAVLDDSQPVTIEFVLSNISTDLIPDAKGLREAFSNAKQFWKEQEIEPAVEFFTDALECFSKDQITVLTIRDRNTKGLLGAHKGYNNPWHNLTKSSGVSDKTPTAGGSFGIGKYAPFACSFFRTVLYSTLDMDGIAAGQGVSRLTSYIDNSGVLRDGVGYLGGEKHAALTSQLLISGLEERKNGETGTDITILGFKQSGSWETDVSISVIDSFLDAIYRGRLRVIVGERTIDNNNISDLINEFKGRFSGHADEYYSVLIAPETVWFTEESFRGLGLIELGLQIREGFHRRVAMVRKTGMKIMDRGNISTIIPFAGIMRIQGVEINKKLRAIENPQHDKWEPERSKNPTESSDLIKSLGKFIREKLDELKKKEGDDAIDPGIGDHLPYEDMNSEQEGKEESESLSDKIRMVEKTIIKHPRKRKTKAESNDGQEEDKVDDNESLGFVGTGSGGEGDNDGEGGNGAGTKDGNGNGETPKELPRKRFSVGVTNARIMCTNKEKGEYLLRFIPQSNTDEGCISLNIVAESDTYRARLKSAFLGETAFDVAENEIHGLNFVKGEAIVLKIILDYHDYCSLEVLAYGHKK